MATLADLSFPEIKRILRNVLDSNDLFLVKTKAELVELGRQHGIVDTPDEWTLGKLLSERRRLKASVTVDVGTLDGLASARSTTSKLSNATGGSPALSSFAQSRLRIPPVTTHRGDPSPASSPGRSSRRYSPGRSPGRSSGRSPGHSPSRPSSPLLGRSPGRSRSARLVRSARARSRVQKPASPSRTDAALAKRADALAAAKALDIVRRRKARHAALRMAKEAELNPLPTRIFDPPATDDYHSEDIPRNVRELYDEIKDRERRAQEEENERIALMQHRYLQESARVSQPLPSARQYLRPKSVRTQGPRPGTTPRRPKTKPVEDKGIFGWFGL